MDQLAIIGGLMIVHFSCLVSSTFDPTTSLVEHNDMQIMSFKGPGSKAFVE